MTNQILNQGVHVFRSVCADRVPVTYDGAEIPEFRIRLQLREPRVILIDCNVVYEHTGLSNGGTVPYSGGLSCASEFIYRQASTEAGLSSATWQFDQNINAGANLMDPSHHYLPLVFPGAAEFDAGFYDFSIFAQAAGPLPLTQDSATQDGIAIILAEGASPPYFARNFYRIIVLPVGALYTFASNTDSACASPIIATIS